ncbi:MAG TPA: Holliday junction resolvase RuvX [Candidatus Nanoarchaeia archaeon]|nr:Holliday junction resolvase RuvX [Candidatus Nanoarchaeia archaeon]
MRLMGIDFGTKRVGIALSDEGCKFAIPKAVLPNDRYLFTEIKRLTEVYEVSEIVMGESKDFKGNDNPIMRNITFFKGELERGLGLPVHLEPEFFTSHQAESVQGKNALLDASAAALILQSYLDKEKKD